MTVWLLIGSLILAISLFQNHKWVYFFTATASFTIYFNPITENISLYLIFMIGISLLIAELYIPDFGIMGIVGTMILIFSVYQKTHDLSQLVLDSLWVVLLVVIVITVMLSMGKEIRLSQQFVLNTALSTQKDAYDLTKVHPTLNAQAEVIETLRPVGKVKLIENDRFVEVISEEGQIAIGQIVYISRIVGSKYFVRVEKNRE